METQGKGSVLATKIANTQSNGIALATPAAATQGKGSVLAVKAAVCPLGVDVNTLGETDERERDSSRRSLSPVKTRFEPQTKYVCLFGGNTQHLVLGAQTKVLTQPTEAAVGHLADHRDLLVGLLHCRAGKTFTAPPRVRGLLEGDELHPAGKCDRRTPSRAARAPERSWVLTLPLPLLLPPFPCLLPQLLPQLQPLPLPLVLARGPCCSAHCSRLHIAPSCGPARTTWFRPPKAQREI